MDVRRAAMLRLWVIVTLGGGLALAITNPLSAQTALLTPPAGPVIAGATAEVTLYLLNEEGTTRLFVVPLDERPAEARWAGGASQVILRRTDGRPKGEGRDLGPGAFVRVPYQFTVPPAARGQVTLTLPDTPPAVLTVNPSQSSPGEPSSAEPVTPSGSDVSAPSAAPPPPADRRRGAANYVAEHFSPYEPIYFLVGAEEPNAKFQISLKYKIFNDDAPLVRALPPLGGLHFGYSQTSFWDLESASSPFFDNSYRPELMVTYADLLRGAGAGPIRQLGFQAGVQHESNGQDGLDSRSVNYVYVRPTLTFGATAADEDRHRTGGFFLTVAPRLHAYVGDDEDNPDIEEFRGYGDLQLVVGQRGGLQLAATGRVGSDFDKGSLQLDLTYPLRPILQDNVDIFLHGQLFTGYGESLLLYDESDTTFRVGVSLIR